MKANKIIFVFARISACFAVSLFAACTNNDENISELKPIRFTADIESATTAKTAIDYDSNSSKYTITWADNDAVMLYSPEAYTNNSNINNFGKFTIATNGNFTAASIPLYWNALKNTHTFYCFYPYSESFSNKTITFTLPSNVDKDSPVIPLWGKKENVTTGSNNVAISLKSVATVLDISLTNSTSQSLIIFGFGVKLSSEENICGSFAFDMETGAVTSSTSTDDSKIVKRLITNYATIDSNKTLNGIYIPIILLSNLTDKQSILLHVYTNSNYNKGYEYTLTPTESISAAPEGKVVKINLTVVTANSITPSNKYNSKVANTASTTNVPTLEAVDCPFVVTSATAFGED